MGNESFMFKTSSAMYKYSVALSMALIEQIFSEILTNKFTYIIIYLL